MEGSGWSPLFVGLVDGLYLCRESIVRDSDSRKSAVSQSKKWPDADAWNWKERDVNRDVFLVRERQDSYCSITANYLSFFHANPLRCGTWLASDFQRGRVLVPSDSLASWEEENLNRVPQP